MSQITKQVDPFEGHSCCKSENHDYSITYKIQNNNTRTNIVCKKCIESEFVFDDKFGKLFFLQENILKIICLHCNQIVTKTKGCKNCKTVFGNLKENQS